MVDLRRFSLCPREPVFSHRAAGPAVRGTRIVSGGASPRRIIPSLRSLEIPAGGCSARIWGGCGGRLRGCCTAVFAGVRAPAGVAVLGVQGPPLVLGDFG